MGDKMAEVAKQVIPPKGFATLCDVGACVSCDPYDAESVEHARVELERCARIFMQRLEETRLPAQEYKIFFKTFPRIDDWRMLLEGRRSQIDDWRMWREGRSSQIDTDRMRREAMGNKMAEVEKLLVGWSCHRKAIMCDVGDCVPYNACDAESREHARVELEQRSRMFLQSLAELRPPRKHSLSLFNLSPKPPAE